MRDFILVAFTILTVILLIIMWIWYVVFGKSLRKMIFTMLGILQDRDAIVDPNAEILPNQERHSSDILREKAAHIKVDVPLEAQYAPPQATLPQYERGELARDTSDNGWPRELSYEERHEQRPFLNANLQTETEVYEPPQDLVQRAEILDVENPIVQPPQAPIDAEIPTDVPHVDASDEGLHSSSLPPGRDLRDKRYNRNESD